MPRYADIDMVTGVVTGDCNLRDAGMEKEFPHLIPIEDSFDLSQKKWDFEKQEWVEYIPEPVEDVIEENLAIE